MKKRKVEVTNKGVAWRNAAYAFIRGEDMIRARNAMQRALLVDSHVANKYLVFVIENIERARLIGRDIPERILRVMDVEKLVQWE